MLILNNLQVGTKFAAFREINYYEQNENSFEVTSLKSQNKDSLRSVLKTKNYDH